MWTSPGDGLGKRKLKNTANKQAFAWQKTGCQNAGTVFHPPTVSPDGQRLLVREYTPPTLRVPDVFFSSLSARCMSLLLCAPGAAADGDIPYHRLAFFLGGRAGIRIPLQQVLGGGCAL
jgi:hypothetical protein